MTATLGLPRPVVAASATAPARRPTVGIFGLTGCAGDQLVLLNCEDELLDLVQLVDLRDFVMAASAPDEECRLDVAFVEGAVVTGKDEQLLRRVRERATTLVAIGTCAVWGGVPGIASPRSRQALLREVYGEVADGYDAPAVRALREVVTVDAEIPGCPIEKSELLSALSALLAGNLPQLPKYPVCTECRIRENRCLLTQDGALCCGPLTVAGCAARCPSQGVACVGCRGPTPDANVASATTLFLSKGYDAEEIAVRLGTFAPVAAARRH
jgi:coenzyme F420-reducing hydrogenase gamma subunit